jgi:predicted small lipoprotein YifL
MTRTLLTAIVVTATSATLAACGGGGTSAHPPGSPQNPLAGHEQEPPAAATRGATDEAAGGSSRRAKRSAEPTSESQPSFQKLVERQTNKPASRFSPCNLVTKSQARAILGTAVADPLEAPQGPTCIYRTQNGKSFITMAMQDARFSQLKAQIRGRHAISVASRTGYCGKLGQPMLYLPVTSGRVLSVAAPCGVARRFAATALSRLGR